MTKQLQATLAAILVMSTISVRAQLSTTTTTTKPTPTTTKTTVVTREAPASSNGKATARKRTAKKATRKAPVVSATELQIRELREEMQNQQAQIDLLKQQNAEKDARLATTTADAQAANASAAAATAQAQSLQTLIQQNSSSVQTLSSDVSDLKIANTGLATTISDTKRDLNEKIESPTTIHYKGVTITPVAFFAAEGVFRNRALNSDINTPFNNIPFPSANEGHVSELNFTGRQSRLGGLFEGRAAGFKLSGYFEGDFLGTGTSSNNNQSNSYVFRQRQIWGQAATDSGLTMTGGQMWSLATEDAKGTDNRTEKLPNTIDSQYMVGFSWERQPAFRLQQRFGNYQTGAMTVAVAAEQAQITSFTANAATAGSLPANYFFAGAGANGGLYNAAEGAGAGNAAGTAAITTYANNVAPDFIAKFAFDDKYAHVELGGVARFLRSYYYPILTTGAVGATPAYTYATTFQSSTRTAGGVFGSIRGSVSKYADLGLSGMVGTGTGRYGSAQLADATLRPDGTLEPVKNYHGLASLETHPLRKLDVFAYYGGEYAKRVVYTTAQGYLIGYGTPNLNNAGCYNLPTIPTIPGTGGSDTPTTCGAPTKYIQEGMFGFIYRVASSPRYGRLQYSATYSLLQRQLWNGIGSATTPVSPRAQDNMIHISMRYYIP